MSKEKYRILYVDDEETNLRVFKNNFRREFDVITAVSGKEALEILSKEEVDVIISDQRMPEMTGVEFFKEVIKSYLGPNRILLTGYSDMQTLADAINEAQLFQYVQKPWNELNLKTIINKAIEAYYLDKKNKELTEILLLSNHELKRYGKLLNDEINRRKIIQEELEKSNERYLEAQRISLLGHWELDIQTNIMKWSEGVYPIFGFDSENTDVTYEKFLSSIHPMDRDMAEDAYNKSVNNKSSFIISHRIVLPTGEVRFVKQQGKTFYNESEEPIMSLTTIQDVTESKLAEKKIKTLNRNLEERVKDRTDKLEIVNNKLIESESKFRDLSELLPQSIFELDRTGKITYTNKYGLELTKYTKENLAEGIFIEQVVHPDDLDRLYKVIASDISTDLNKADIEYRILSKEGKELKCLIYLSRIIKDGNVTGLRGVIVDITDQVKS